MQGTLVTIVSTMRRHPPAIRLEQLGGRTACCVAAARDRLLLAGRRSAVTTCRRSAPFLLNLAWAWLRPVMLSTCSMDRLEDLQIRIDGKLEGLFFRVGSDLQIWIC